jgi:DNA-binding MarR family transcriptional regulator
MDADPLPAPAAIGLLLRQAHRRSAKAFAERLRPLGLENRQAGLLMQIELAGNATQRRLIELFGTDKSTMVRTIDELEARGLAVRRPHPEDRRAHAVEITPAGRAVLVRVRAAAAEAGGGLLAGFAPAEQEQLRSLLARFVSAEQR